MTIEILKAKPNDMENLHLLSVRFLDTKASQPDPLEYEVFLAVQDEWRMGLIAAGDGGTISHLYVHPESEIDKVASLLLDRMVCALKMKGEDRLSLLAPPESRAFFLAYGFAIANESRETNGEGAVLLYYRPQEIFDVLDDQGQHTGRYVERGRRLNPGDYHLVVHVWKFNKQGQWLIDRRSFQRGSSIDGKWETTGGAAVAGDDSLQAALRETAEELGITLDPAKGRLYQRSFRQREDGHGWIQDCWIFEWDGLLDEIRFQAAETCDAKWVDLETISRMIDSGEFLGEQYYPYFPKLQKEMGNQRIGGEL